MGTARLLAFFFYRLCNPRCSMSISSSWQHPDYSVILLLPWQGDLKLPPERVTGRNANGFDSTRTAIKKSTRMLLTETIFAEVVSNICEKWSSSDRCSIKINVLDHIRVLTTRNCKVEALQLIISIGVIDAASVETPISASGSPKIITAVWKLLTMIGSFSRWCD